MRKCCKCNTLKDDSEFARTKALREHLPVRCKKCTAKRKAAYAIPSRRNGAKRDAMLLYATPIWANKELIAQVYALARARTIATGIPHCVYHIVPLLDPLVCGLHIEQNLQVSLRKGNRFT